MKTFLCATGIFLLLATSAFATVNVSTPINGSKVTSPVEYKKQREALEERHKKR